jgi:hypothetical protein
VTFARRLAVVALAALALCAAAAAATGDPQYQLSTADQAWTDSIILTTEDVGTSWKRDGLPGGITGADSGASSSCSLPDMSDLVLTGGTYSPDFYRSDGAYVASTAVAWQTPEQAAADWSRSLQPAVMGCLAADLQAESTKQVKIVIANVRRAERRLPDLDRPEGAREGAQEVAERVRERDGRLHRRRSGTRPSNALDLLVRRAPAQRLHQAEVDAADGSAHVHVAQ